MNGYNPGSYVISRDVRKDSNLELYASPETDGQFRQLFARKKPNTIENIILAIGAATLLFGIAISVAHYRFGALSQGVGPFTAGSIATGVLFSVSGLSIGLVAVRRLKNCLLARKTNLSNPAEQSPILDRIAENVPVANPVTQNRYSKESVLARLNDAKETNLKTHNGIDFPAIWAPVENSKSTVVIFPEASIYRSIIDVAEWYHKCGMNVLVVSYAPLKDNNEESDYIYSAEAAVQFVAEKISDGKIVVHGDSKGGAIAAIAASTYNLPLVLDNVSAKPRFIIEDLPLRPVEMRPFMDKAIDEVQPNGLDTCARIRTCARVFILQAINNKTIDEDTFEKWRKSNPRIQAHKYSGDESSHFVNDMSETRKIYLLHTFIHVILKMDINKETPHAIEKSNLAE